jgi:hypothetical protein
VKLKLLVFLVAFLLVSMLGSPELISGSSEQPYHSNTNALKVPSYLTDIPPGHFTGVSVPSDSLAKARRSAIGDVIRQILGSIGVQYNHHYFDEITGNVRNPRRVINDRLSGTAHGILLDVEKNIVQNNWSNDTFGKYVYFVLVYYPEKKIREMRRLSKGAKVIATVVSKNDNYVELRVSEVNGVSVVISKAEVTIIKKNKFAKIITLFFWKVPLRIQNTASFPLEPIEMCSNSANIQQPINISGKNLVDYLLGSDFERFVVFTGHDEIGRAIAVKAEF